MRDCKNFCDNKTDNNENKHANSTLFHDNLFNKSHLNIIIKKD